MKLVRLKVPAKVMLAGEYSVLKGGHALAAALNRFMTIEVEYHRHLSQWHIESDIWQSPRILSDLRSTETDPLCRAVQSEARHYSLSGGRVRVRSDIDIQDGIGSSSALRLGISAAMEILRNGRGLERSSGVSTQCIHRAWALQSEAQGQASGYDLATQYLGGLVEFQTEYLENQWKPHWFRLPVEHLSDIIHVFVGGSGAPTTTTMQSTGTWLDGGQKVDRLLEVSEVLIDSFLAFIRFPSKAYFKKLVDSVAAHRGLFGGSPMFPTEIATALAETPGHDGPWTWKPTGAGGEDALLIIGPLESVKPAVTTLYGRGWRRLEADFTEQGIQIEEFIDEPKENVEAKEKLATLPHRSPSFSGSVRHGPVK